jgi:GGDEF domain-containing protein
VDNLTGVLRRGPFETELDATLALGHRHPLPVTLAFLDVDHFKRINDQGGHAAGDRVLQALGQLLGHRLRPATAAAVGGRGVRAAAARHGCHPGPRHDAPADAEIAQARIPCPRAAHRSR